MHTGDAAFTNNHKRYLLWAGAAFFCALKKKWGQSGDKIEQQTEKGFQQKR